MSKKLTIPPSTLNEQLAASNPKSSAWVSANAGSGKTHVLTQRVIRLMLAGNVPDRILCLTFTKAAAANMKNRVFSTLAGWTVMPDEKLVIELEATTGKPPSREALRRARQLFAEALDTPGGLKIQTIHAFCESLLHQFPLEANVSGHFEVLQETAQAALLEEAKSRVFSGRSGQDVSGDLDFLIAHHSDATLDTALSELIANRQKFLDWAVSDVHLPLRLEELALALELDDIPSEEAVISILLTEADGQLEYLRAVAAEGFSLGGSSNLSSAKRITSWVEAKDIQHKYMALSDMCLTGSNTVRKSGGLGDKKLKGAFPDYVDVIEGLGERCLEAQDKLNRILLHEHSSHMFRLALSVLDEYERLKRSHGQIDYDDQIEKCVNLLQRSDIRDWVRYRLDRGIDHVLVDEAQDTSPAQWQIINAITEDFFAGETAAFKGRTVFVVGDEKQSIYSFQGADPAEFAIQERQLKRNTQRSDKRFYPAKLALSFRSTPDVLKAVDKVFKTESNRIGLTQDNSYPIHNAIRERDPGEVLVWPLFAPDKQDEPENWLDPIDREGEGDPAVQLAQRISDSVGEWVGTQLPGMDAPLKFGDILVLVRRRDKRFITALTRTMKDAGLAVAGSDRLQLLEHIAIEDLLAIGRFVLMPLDDLNLAALLKGPLFNWSEEDLFELAHNRIEPGLYDTLQKAGNDSALAISKRCKQAVDLLQSIIHQGNTRDVLGFYLWVMVVLGARRTILSRLGSEAEDVLDAFVDEILDFQRDGGLGLEEFIARLTKANPEIKRELELDRDEVRILTVHSSKGLEARVVFLVDPCNPAWNSNHRSKIVQFKGADDKTHQLWVPVNEHQIEVTQRIAEEEQVASEAEYRRLLYVGMTRAADRLVVCGYKGKNAIKHEHWHSMVMAALEDEAEHITDENGELVELKWSKTPLSLNDNQPDTASPAKVAEETHIPDWLMKPAAVEAPLPHPLTPSGAFALIDRDLKTKRTPAFETVSMVNTHSLETGNAVHRLLEVLPEIPESERETRAREYIKVMGSAWQSHERENAIGRVIKILDDPQFAFLFSANSRSEVPIAGKLEMKNGPRMISGQIDRLVIGENEIHIVDFKTNRFIPPTAEEFPKAYIIQLALYKSVIAEIYPHHKIHCGLLWTNGPQLDLLAGTVVDEALEQLVKG